MIIFIITFMIASVFNYIADKNAKNQIVLYFFSFLSLFIVSALAGLRDIGVGADTEVYIEEGFHLVIDNNYGLNDLIKYFKSSPLFWLFFYICTMTFRNVHWVLFFIELFICCPFYFAAVNMRKNKNGTITMAMIVFYFMFYIETYNTMRQCMAVAVIVYGLEALQNSRVRTYILSVIIAMGFHQTAFLGIGPLIFFLMVKNRKYAKLICGLIIICSICLMYFYEEIILQLISIGLLQERFNYYLTSFIRAEAEGGITNILISLILIMSYLFTWGNLEKKVKNSYMLLCMSFVGTSLAFLNRIISYSYRAALYFDIYPQIYLINNEAFAFKKESKRLFYLGMISFLFFIFYWKLVKQGWGGVYPYTSQIIGLG